MSLYFYTYKVSVNTMVNQLVKAQEIQLSVVAEQLDNKIRELASMLLTLKEDPDLRAYQRMYLESKLLDYDKLTLISRIQDKLVLQSASTSWVNTLSFYSPSLNTSINSNSGYKLFHLPDEKLSFNHWNVQTVEQDGKNHFIFFYRLADPVNAYKDSQLKFFLEVQFSDTNIRRVLDSFKVHGRNDPFFYHPEYGLILNSTSQVDELSEIQSHLKGIKTDDSGNFNLVINAKEHLVTYVLSKEVGWYLIDYIPTEDIFSPVIESRNSFFLSSSVLFILSIAAAYLLYYQVLLPIKALMQGTQRLELGDYRYRIVQKASNEFRFLFSRFNRMAEKIQTLIERVYEEKIRVREATVKQLQSQINPHFLYNCLAFINSMAKMEDYKSIEAMSYHLRQYYRYGTDVQNQTVLLKEEIELIKNYLEIQRMRVSRLHYEIDIPDHILHITVPRFILQPLVENAVIHGIESTPNAGRIHITCREEGEYILLQVDDDGPGLSDDRLRSLQSKLEAPLNENMGCGAWNVHQRLKFGYGSESGLQYNASTTLGGVSVLMILKHELLQQIDNEGS